MLDDRMYHSKRTKNPMAGFGSVSLTIREEVVCNFIKNLRLFRGLWRLEIWLFMCMIPFNSIFKEK
jgi:hypothetical protein